MLSVIQNKKPLEISWGLVSTGKSPVLGKDIGYLFSNYNICCERVYALNKHIAKNEDRNLFSADLKESGQDYFSVCGETREIGE